MERKIDETFEYGGKKLQVKESDHVSCDGCFFDEQCTLFCRKVAGHCEFENRADGKDVIFVESTEQNQAEQPQELNLSKILRYCPNGETFWSPLLDDVRLYNIDEEEKKIVVIAENGVTWGINADATITINGVKSPEIMLYPSREQRDWTKVKYEKKKERFDPQTLKPFDRVLCQHDNYSKWQCNLFSHIHPDYKNLDYPVHGMTNTFMYCIPYNDETKHLIGTTDEAPEYYKYWEE